MRCRAEKSTAAFNDDASHFVSAYVPSDIAKSKSQSQACSGSMNMSPRSHEGSFSCISRPVPPTTSGGVCSTCGTEASIGSSFIFENDYLQPAHIERLCQICTEVKVAFVKTSTGYGFVKQANGMYAYQGATVPHLKLMREASGPDVQIKAAGGVRTLDDLLPVMSLGVTRIGATATAQILEEAKKRGITEEPKSVSFTPIGENARGGY